MMGDRRQHMAMRQDDPCSEPFPVVVTVNVIENYVLLEDGTQCDIDTYLNGNEEVVEDGEDAFECWVWHPNLQCWLIIEIDPIPVRMN